MSDDALHGDAARGRLRSLACHPLAMLLTYGVMAGAAFSISKLAMGVGVRPIAYTFWQVAGAAVVLLAIGLVRGDRFPFSRRHLAFYAVCGLPGLALPYANVYITVEHLPAGVMALVLATIPIFTYGLAVALGVERIERRRLAGVACGFVGVILILAPRASLPTPDLTVWALLAFLSPVLFAASHMVVFKYRPPDTGTLPLTVGMLVAASAALLPAAWLTGEFYVPRIGAPGIAELIIVVQICTAAANYLLFFEIIRRAGPVFFSQIGYVLTLTAMMWAALIFGESYSLWIWGATGLVFAGIALTKAHAKVPDGAGRGGSVDSDEPRLQKRDFRGRRGRRRVDRTEWEIDPMSDILFEECESFEPQNRRDAARALRQALIYLQCEASDTGLPFTAYCIGLAAMSAAEAEAENYTLPGITDGSRTA